MGKALFHPGKRLQRQCYVLDRPDPGHQQKNRRVRWDAETAAHNLPVHALQRGCNPLGNDPDPGPDFRRYAPQRRCRLFVEENQRGGPLHGPLNMRRGTAVFSPAAVVRAGKGNDPGNGAPGKKFLHPRRCLVGIKGMENVRRVRQLDHGGIGAGVDDFNRMSPAGQPFTQALGEDAVAAVKRHGIGADDGYPEHKKFWYPPLFRTAIRLTRLIAVKTHCNASTLSS